MRIMIGLGGQAVGKGERTLDTALQQEHVAHAADVLSELATDHDVVITHGSGPQVGLLALQAESAGVGVPLEVLGAESEGLLGYWLEQELGNRLPQREVATLLTQVEVDPGDPAFKEPSKPIGPALEEKEARRRAERLGWTVAPDEGGWRRLVACPEPRAVVESRTLRLLVNLGVVAVCGGGIPVVRDGRGRFHGVEAVVDKDLTASLLASQLEMDALLLLTDVPAVWAEWPEPAGQVIKAMPPRAAHTLQFDPATMGPKVEAARRFAVQTGGVAAIGSIEDAPRILRGEAGTSIHADVPEIEYVDDPGAGL